MILKIKIDYTALQDDFHFKNIIKTIFILILSLLYLEKLLESTFVLISRTFLLKYYLVLVPNVSRCISKCCINIKKNFFKPH